MKVIQDFLTVNHQKGRKGPYPPDVIVIHVVQGSREACRSWFKNPSSNVSAHYLVTKKGAVYQFVQEYDTAWANGRKYQPTAAVVLARPDTNPNWWTISIENEGSGNEELTTPQRLSLLALIRDIQKRHPLITSDRQHILRHQEIYGKKTCPGAIDVDRLVRELNEPDFSDVTSGSSTTDPTP